MKTITYYLLPLVLGLSTNGYAAPDVAQVQGDIQQTTSHLEAQRNESDGIQDEVTRLEKKLSEISQKMEQTEKKIEATSSKLQQATQQKITLETDLNNQKTGLAQQVQALYSAGEQSYLRLLLRQDNPADISRTLHYFEYLNKSRVKKIQSIEKNLSKATDARERVSHSNQELQELNQDLTKQKSELEQLLAAREQSLRTISSDIRGNEKRLDKLRTDESKFQQVVDQLAQAASFEAADVMNVSSNTKPTATARPAFLGTKAFATRSSMNWPIQGKIIHGYGSSRNEKQRWRGVVISAAGGTKVKAVARGRVIYSNWMDGYGYLVILEHDSKYLSLYGYNRTLYKKEGDIVNAGDIIAAVGNSSGQKQDGLYFEIRQGNTPQNPAKWCR